MKKSQFVGLVFYVLIALFPTKGIAGSVKIAIDPTVVALGQTWYAHISGLRPYQGGIVLGNGYDDGNWMYRKIYQADSHGDIYVEPPPFQVYTSPTGQVASPVGVRTFVVLKLLGGGGSKVLATKSYEVVP